VAAAAAAAAAYIVNGFLIRCHLNSYTLLHYISLSRLYSLYMYALIGEL
jgi:hypothetical protein